MIIVSQYLNLDKYGRLVNARKEEVFLQQGDMDGACSIYSLMMSLIACVALKREVATDIWKNIDGRTREAHLVKEFFMGKDGMYRDGMFLNELADRLTDVYGKKVWAKYYAEDLEIDMTHPEFIYKLCDDISAGFVCLIGINYSTGEGHAMFAVGYEEEDGEIVRVFCLDPGRPLQPCSYWNAVINIDSARGEYCDLYLPNGSKVYLDDYIAIEKI